jgi:hypothetical protein
MRGKIMKKIVLLTFVLSIAFGLSGCSYNSLTAPVVIAGAVLAAAAISAAAARAAVGNFIYYLSFIIYRKR